MSDLKRDCKIFVKAVLIASYLHSNGKYHVIPNQERFYKDSSVQRVKIHN